METVKRTSPGDTCTDSANLLAMPLEIILNIIVSNNLLWQDLASLQQSNHFLNEMIRTDEEYIFKRLYHKKWGNDAEEIEKLVHDLVEKKLQQSLTQYSSVFCPETQQWLPHTKTIQMPSTLYNFNAVTWKEKYRNRILPCILSDLTCDKAEIHRGETVTFNLTLENIGAHEEQVFLCEGYRNDECSVIEGGSALYIWKPAVKTEDGYLNNKKDFHGRDYMCASGMEQLTAILKPGDKKTFKIPFLFDRSLAPQRVFLGPVRVPRAKVPPGTFSLQGKLHHVHVADAKTPDVFPLQVFVQVQTYKERFLMHDNEVYGHCSLVNSNIVNLTLYKS
mmetsp:Transcript_27102/g.30218  ORF Transcript_27102/g.30218 Transcript_27102/m.30218 type:complete len:334 (-) Transcript_27102:28-1029(-)